MDNSWIIIIKRYKTFYIKYRYIRYILYRNIKYYKYT